MIRSRLSLSQKQADPATIATCGARATTRADLLLQQDDAAHRQTQPSTTFSVSKVSVVW